MIQSPVYLFFAIAGVTFLLTHAYRMIALKFNWLDQDVHQIKKGKSVPTSGGLVIFLMFWLSMNIVYPGLFQNKQYVGTFVATSVVCLTGFIDDRYELKPLQKSIGIFIAANIIYYISDITFSSNLLTLIPEPLHNISVWFFTIAWIFIVTNAINLLDGLDGLATSVTIISLLTHVVVLYFFSSSIHFVHFIMLTVLISVLIGFLGVNWYPAKVYLGDTGALFIGFMYGVLSVTQLKNATIYSLLIPFIIYMVPLLDTFLAIVRRLYKRQSITKADHEHIHHRLLKISLKEWQVVLVMVIITVIFSCFAVLVQALPQYRFIVLLGFVSLTVILFILYYQARHL